MVCNDLNPEAIKYCRENVKLNKVGKRVLPFNMDAREFVRFHVAQASAETPDIPSEFHKFDHCYMNLPVDAVEFCDVFIGLFKDASPKVWCKDPADITTIQLPLVHVYGFTFERERDAAL